MDNFPDKDFYMDHCDREIHGYRTRAIELKPGIAKMSAIIFGNDVGFPFFNV